MTGTVFPLISNSISSSSSQESTGSSGSSSSPLPQIMKHSNSTENQASSEIETTLTETTTRIHKMFNKQIGKKYADLKPSFSIQWDLEDRKWNCTIALKTEFKTRSYVWDLEEEEYIFPELIAHKYISLS